MICTVSGPVKSIAGQLLPMTRVKVWRAAVVGQDGALVMPQQALFEADATGTLVMGLFPGLYNGTATDPLGCPVYFTLSVPEESEADLADCLESIAPITPALVAEVRQIKAEVEQMIEDGGIPGPSAYEVAQEGGFDGSESEWLASLVGPQGASAYEAAVSNGFSGSESAWLASLVGDQGPSAYQVALANGFTGSQAQWLESLKGQSFTVMTVTTQAAFEAAPNDAMIAVFKYAEG